jgi:serine/threonine-protein kinase RsbW
VVTISLTIPGDAAHLAVLRATVAAVAARAHLTIDQVEDVRLAVEEAASTLLTGAPAEIETTVDVGVQPLTIRMSAQTDGHVDLDPDGFSYTILTAMTDELDIDEDGGRIVVTMRFAALATSR